MAGQTEGFEEVEEHGLVDAAVDQIRRIGSDESTRPVFRSALGEKDREGQSGWLDRPWCCYRIIVKEVLGDFLGISFEGAVLGVGCASDELVLRVI